MTIERELLEAIDESTFYTTDALLTAQERHAPVVNYNRFNNVKKIKYKGEYFRMIFKDKYFFETTLLSYQWFKNTKPKFEVDTVFNLVSKQIMFPVLFFLDGKLQKWTDVYIVPENNITTYVIINNNYTTDKKLPLDTVFIPLTDILYMEKPTYEEIVEIKNKSSFTLCFDKEGKIIFDNEDTSVYTIIGFYESHRLEVDTNTDMRTLNNIDYYLVDRTKLDNEYIGNRANLAFDNNNKFIGDIDNNLQFIGDNAYRLNTKLNKKDIKAIFTFIYKGSTGFKTDMKKRIGSDNSDLIVKYNSTTGKEIKQFNLELDDKKWDWLHTKSEENIRKAVKSILQYDQSILKSAYLKKSKVVSETYTVEDFLNRFAIDNIGTCSIPRMRKGLLNNSLMMFIDGKLFSYDRFITDKSNNIKVSLGKYTNKLTSEVDLVFFTDTENSVYTYNIHSDNTEVIIPEDINPNYLEIYAKVDSPHNYRYDFEYDITPNEFTYIPIKFTMEKCYQNVYKIKFENGYFYGRDVIFTSRRQFRHKHVVWQNSPDYRIYLDAEFNYLSNDDAFMIFINGRKINRENFIVTIPSELRPFDRSILEITTFLDKGDDIDIFYLPDNIKTINLKDNTQYGPLAMVSDKIIYNLSKDLQFFFVNGRKIARDHIEDISANHVVIDKAYSNYDLDIVYYIDGFDIINETYNELENKEEYMYTIMKDLYKSLDPNTYSNETELLNQLGEKMLDNNYILKNIEENYQKYHASILSLMNNIIMEYYADYGIETNKAFVFDICTGFLEEFKEKTHVEYEKRFNGTKVENTDTIRKGSPTDDDKVYRIDLFTEDGLLNYTIRNDNIDGTKKEVNKNA